MKIDIETLIETLEKSVERNGEKPLTNKWLLNLVKQVKKSQELHQRTDIAPDYFMAPKAEIDDLTFVSEESFFQVYDNYGNGIAAFRKEYVKELIEFLTNNT
jgi:hypothetical protein